MKAFFTRTNWRPLAVMGFDLAAVAVAWCGAFLLRFNGQITPDYLDLMYGGLLLLVPIEALIFRINGLYRGIWVFASLPDLLRIVNASFISTVGIAVVALLMQPTVALPRLVWLFYPVLLLFIMGGGRLAWRVYKEHREYGALRSMGRPVLVIGTGYEAINLMDELARSSDWHVVGLLDAGSSRRRHREIRGVRVLGSCQDVAHWAALTKADHAIIAVGGTNSEQRRSIANICLRSGVQALVVPAIGEILSDNNVRGLRELRVEDLLGREPVSIDTPQVRDMLAGRVVLVTGAGGSIGSELCRQVARFDPARIIALEQNEFALYSLYEEFRDFLPTVELVAVAGDVKSSSRMQEVIERYAPVVVFHAAAYKHVPLMEEHNAWEAVRNNVFGTLVVGRAAANAGVERFVLVSTDKAVNPTNVMGASKRLAEIVCQRLKQKHSQTRFEVVRFGNVLGSAGSVIPKFQRQISRGGPVTVTHPEITRYFMASHEAVQLVLQAAAMGDGGEIFVLDMGEPIKVVDLAHNMIRLSGHTVEEIPISFIGLRAGEKLYEEVLADSEKTRPTHHEKLRIARSFMPDGLDFDVLLQWLTWNGRRSDDETRRDLRRWVPEYVPYNPPRPQLILQKAQGEN